MSFIKPKVRETVFAVIVVNRDVFPVHLAKEGRLEILSVLEELVFGYVILNESDTEDGVVESYSDAKKCAELFKENKEHLPKLF